MSGTEFAAEKLKHLQLTLSYLLQSVNFQLVYGVSSDPFIFQYMFGSPVFKWPAATKFHSAISLPCLYISSPSMYLQHGQQEEAAWGSDMVKQIEDH
jgi:hypothetical protein